MVGGRETAILVLYFLKGEILMDTERIRIECIDPIALEMQAMDAWVKKLAVKTKEYEREHNSFKKAKLASELISMIEQHINALREGAILNICEEASIRDTVLKGITNLEAILMVLRFSKNALDKINLFGGSDQV